MKNQIPSMSKSLCFTTVHQYHRSVKMSGKPNRGKCFSGKNSLFVCCRPPVYRTQVYNSNLSRAAPSKYESQREGTPEKRLGQFVPLWLQVLLFLIIVGFLVYVFMNMESAETEPFKRLTQDICCSGAIKSASALIILWSQVCRKAHSRSFCLVIFECSSFRIRLQCPNGKPNCLLQAHSHFTAIFTSDVVLLYIIHFRIRQLPAPPAETAVSVCKATVAFSLTYRSVMGKLMIQDAPAVALNLFQKKK